jgi:hypothetical protein
MHETTSDGLGCYWPVQTPTSCNEQVPISEVTAIAPMQRLEQLSGCPADVLEAEAHVVMQVVLDSAH